MKRFWFHAITLVVLLLAVLFLIRTKSNGVSFTDFKWSFEGKIAHHSFRLSNSTNNAIVVSVLLVAENANEGRDGTKLMEIGRQQLEVLLASNEEKKMEGSFLLSQSGSSQTAISHYISTKKPSK
jgi:hypothetical protein